MKRFLVLLLCGMLAVSSVGMNVYAAEPSTQATVENKEELAKDAAKILQDYYKNKKFTDDEKDAANEVMKDASNVLGCSYDASTGKFDINKFENIQLESSEGFVDFIKQVKEDLDKCKTPVQEPSALDKLAEEIAGKLEDYYKNSNFSADEKKKADAVMKEAAKALGYTYTASNGTLTDDKSLPLGRDSEEGLKSLETNIKAQLDACKTKAPEPTPEPEEKPNSNIIIGGKEYDTTTANAGHHCEIAVPLVNLGDTKVTNVVITPVLSSDPTAWPFDIERTDYSKTCDELEGEDSGEEVKDRKHTFRWTLRTRDDAYTGYTKLQFNVTYNEIDGSKGSVTLDYYVQVNGVEPVDEDGKLSTPRVIVTGFTTTPEEVFAGDTFTLTLNLKNTSKETAVSNMLFDIQGTQEGTDANNTYAAFLPTAGSSTIYVDSIAPNATKSISIELKSKADLAQKPYVVTVNMEYEDKDANAFTETASVSVPIKQEAKTDISSISVMPDSAQVGNDVNVMFSIYNVGKTKLYNVNVKFEADSVTGGDTFLGNLEPGATGNVDVYLSAQAPTMDDGTVKILITYEDEEGKQAVIEKTMTLFVSEPYYEEFVDDPMMMEGMEEEKAGLPWWAIALIIAVVVIAAVAAVLVFRKKKRAKLLAQAELEMIEALEDNDDSVE